MRAVLLTQLALDDKFVVQPARGEGQDRIYLGLYNSTGLVIERNVHNVARKQGLVWLLFAGWGRLCTANSGPFGTGLSSLRPSDT